MRSSSSTLVSWPMVKGSREYTGPVSSPSSSAKTHEAVVGSPDRTAHWTGAAPLHRGRSEKCRFTQPWAGIARTSGGTRPP